MVYEKYITEGFMRKIALFCVFCMLLMMVPAMAAGEGVSVKLKNASQDIITVSGVAPTDTMVAIQIFNPEKSAADVNESGAYDDTAAVQYFGSVLSSGGAFTKDIKLNASTGGIFTITVTVAGETSSVQFPYYPYGLKETYVNRIDTETDADALALDLPEILKVFGFEIHDLYTSTTDLSLAKEICKENTKVTLANPDEALVFLDEVIVVNAFNEDNQLLKDENGIFVYDEVWAKENPEAYADYAGELSENGIANVNTALFAGTYNKIGDVYDTFEDSLLYQLIMNNRLSGSGHIEAVLLKYDDQFKAYGFDLDLLNGASGKKSKFNTLLGCGATSLETMADKFNEIFDKNASSGSGSSGGSGGGGGGGASSVGSVPSAGGAENYVPTTTPTTSPEPTAPQTVCPFTDLAGADWAKEAVEYLYKEGIINGRDEKTFAPGELVTRAEFAKIIVEAFKLPEVENAASFGDCAADAWYTPYILRAAGNNVVTGYDGLFDPNKPITREDAAVIVARLFENDSEASLSFTDADEVSDYAKEAVAMLSKAGLVNGVGDGKFAPKVNITRAQAAQLVYNVISGGENS